MFLEIRIRILCGPGSFFELERRFGWGADLRHYGQLTLVAWEHEHLKGHVLQEFVKLPKKKREAWLEERGEQMVAHIGKKVRDVIDKMPEREKFSDKDLRTYAHLWGVAELDEAKWMKARERERRRKKLAAKEAKECARIAAEEAPDGISDEHGRNKLRLAELLFAKAKMEEKLFGVPVAKSVEALGAPPRRPDAPARTPRKKRKRQG